MFPKPTNITGTRIWQETVTIPTYQTPPPGPNPMFFEKRINQGASGGIYPNPFTEQVNIDHKTDQEYQAVFLENEYLQLMVLPQFGGRIHAALDKTNGYDFIYRQHVIKPMLIGLFGPWLSGGMEFNWPLHHRPSTFMPVEYVIEEADDGAVIVWLSEHEPMNRMKGMVGICLYPGKAFFELKVQLHNRTPLAQPFLWWVNAGVRVNEQYQLIFPPDVDSVAFHSRAFMTSYPQAKHIFAGCDWRKGVDISWPTNVTNATSYFANASKYNFFGGYDHGAQGGIIHIANRHISPGKKLFTWGTGELGTRWQTNLTDDDGDYVELMASAYSDNQPDFSWLQPHETNTFSQIWYPIQQIGAVKNANIQVAVNLEPQIVGVCATEQYPDAKIVLTHRDEIIFSQQADFIPGQPFIWQTEDEPFPIDKTTTLTVTTSRGEELIRYTPELPTDQPLPETAKPPMLPHKIDSLEELYLTGLHVEQNLHFALDPTDYWERALSIDPTDSRVNTALGRLLVRRGNFAQAETHLRRAIKTLTRYNFNPANGESYYYLGLALTYQSHTNEAYDAFYKAIWSYAWQSAGYFALAQIDCRRGDYDRAVAHLDRSLSTNRYNNQAWALRIASLRRMGDVKTAVSHLHIALTIDPLGHWAQSEKCLTRHTAADEATFTRIMRGDLQNYLDLAFNYLNAGMVQEATNLLQTCDNSYPMVDYALGYFAAQMDNLELADEHFQKGAARNPHLCFPHRLEEQLVLEAALQHNPQDARAAYYLGNLYYDKKQYAKAIVAWQTATQFEPSFSIAWRNLGIALFNQQNDRPGAQSCYEKALAANIQDARLLLEHDLLWQRLGKSQSERLALMKQYPDLVKSRDDLIITLSQLHIQTGQPQQAIDLLFNHQFHPWEGGEGKAATQYVIARNLLAAAALQQGDTATAFVHFEATQQLPSSIGVGTATPVVRANDRYQLAGLHETLGHTQLAQTHYQQVLDIEAEGSLWQPISELTYYAGLALEKLGDAAAARRKFEALKEYAHAFLANDDKVGFKTSKADTSIFDLDSLEMRQIQGHFLLGLAYFGLADWDKAEEAYTTVLSIDPNHFEARQFKEMCAA